MAQDATGRNRYSIVCDCKCGNTYIVKKSHFDSRDNLMCSACSNARRSQIQIPNLIGKHFGRLLVLGQIERQKTKHVMWDCICDCGKQTQVTTSDLLSGHIKSCGCLQRERTSDHNRKNWSGYCSEAGVKIVAPAFKNSKGTWLWNCICPRCGKEFAALPGRVMSGHIKSCGCGKARTGIRRDLSGQVVGYLTCLYPIQERGRQTRWMCRCVCGKEYSVPISSLQEGMYPSCGCIHESKNSIYVKKLLNEHRCYFRQEYCYSDCKNQKALPFDFAVFKGERVVFLIEVQGAQHYHPVEFFGGEKTFAYRRKNDQIKRTYCANNKIPLLELPYSLTKDEIKKEVVNAIYRNDCDGMTGNSDA